MMDRIEPRKAETIFPFMEELNEQDDMDAYDENFIENSAEEDLMTAEEEGFMIGYVGA